GTTTSCWRAKYCSYCGRYWSGESVGRNAAARRYAWLVRSCSVALSTACRVSTSPSPIVSETQRRTITAIAWNRRERRLGSGLTAASLDQLVAGAADGADALRVVELAPQLRDVHVHGAGAARVGHAPDEVEQPLAREHDPRVLEEAREQVELLARQLDRLAAHRHLARVAAEDDVPRREDDVLGAALGATQDRLDPRRQLARRERLRDVVVGAELEAGDTVGFLVTRGEHDDRHLR